MIVFTAAAGFKMKYNSAIKHIVYGLSDHKNENISSYFDLAAYQINKCKEYSYVKVWRMEGFWCIVGLECPGYVLFYVVAYLGYGLFGTISSHELSGGIEVYER